MKWFRAWIHRQNNYWYEGDSIQFEQAFAARQQQIGRGLRLLSLSARDLRTAELTKLLWVEELSFLAVVDANGHVVAGASRQLQANTVTAAAEVTNPALPATDRWIPTTLPPVVIKDGFYRNSQVRVGAALQAKILKNARTLARPLVGNELLAEPDLVILGLREQASLWQTSTRPMQGLAITAVQALPSGDRWLIGGYLLNGTSALVDKQAYLTGKQLVSIDAPDQRISTTKIDPHTGRRALGSPVPAILQQQVVAQAQGIWTDHPLADIDGAYYVSAHPIYDHTLELAPLQAKPVGLIEIGMPMAYIDNYVAKTVSKSVVVIVPVALGVLTVGAVAVGMIFVAELRNKRLQQAREAILHSAGNGLLGFDDQQRCVFANRAACDMLGICENELLACDLAAVQSRLSLAGSRCNLELGGATARLGEVALRRPDGTSLPVEVMLSNNYGPACLTVLTLNNLSERKRAETEERHAALLRERNRLARDIHDLLAHNFLVVSRELEAFVSNRFDNTHERLRMALAAARQGLAAARKSMDNLRSGDSPLNLVSTIEQFVDEQATISHLKVHFARPRSHFSLPAEIEKELFLIVKEAFLNASKHAHASRVDISAIFDPKAVYLEIADDGCGFDPETVQQGCWGLVGMAERADKIHAEMDVDTEPGSGTRIRVVLPVATAVEALSQPEHVA